MLSQLLKILLQFLGNKITHKKTTRINVKSVTGKKYSNEIIHQLNINRAMTNNIQIISYNFNDYLSQNNRRNKNITATAIT
jgi:hypothetical protein